MPQKTITAKEKREKEELAKQFGAVLSDYRKRAGLTQEQLADKADFHRTYIGFMEQGVYSPNLYTLTKLAKALRISPSDLIARIK